MTLRELINQVTDNQMDLSEPFVELDYQFQIQEFTGFTYSLLSNDISLNEQAKQIVIKLPKSRNKWVKDGEK